MTGYIIQFLVSAAVIVGAGGALTQFGDIISNRTKLGGLLVGSILIAGATSLPELAIDISAVRMGSIDLAVGDLVGSSIFNLLILAVMDLTTYSRGRMLSKTSAGHALAGGTSIVLTAIVALFIFLGPTLGDSTLLRLGPGSFVLIAAYAMGTRLAFRGQKEAGKKGPDDQKEHEAAIPWLKKVGLKGAIIGYVATAVVILIAAPFLAKAADHIAEESGLGGTFFGTTFVALCTSLPEIVTTFAAVRIKAFDMALGNIFGSNCFNMVIFVPLDLFHKGSLLSAVSQTHVYTALSVIVITSIVIMGQLYPVEKKKRFIEPDALLTIALIFAALTGLYFVRE
jgi:cation:H+ antiporter